MDDSNRKNPKDGDGQKSRPPGSFDWSSLISEDEQSDYQVTAPYGSALWYSQVESKMVNDAFASAGRRKAAKEAEANKK